MPNSEHNEATKAAADATSNVQIAVWFRTESRTVSDDFAVELVGFETWVPDRDPWEVKHTFFGLVPEAPYTIRIHSGDPDFESIEIRFWAPSPRDGNQRFADWLIDFTDNEIVAVSPGFRSTERRYPRKQPPTLRGQVDNFWRRRGALVGIGFIAIITGLLYLLPLVTGDEENEPNSSGFPNREVRITYRALRLDGSQEMLVSVVNDTGGTEEHVITVETWEYSRDVDSSESLWMDVQNLSRDGAVRCEMLINGEPWIAATSSGARVTAHCYGYPIQTFK